MVLFSLSSISLFSLRKKKHRRKLLASEAQVVIRARYFIASNAFTREISLIRGIRAQQVDLLNKVIAVGVTLGIGVSTWLAEYLSRVAEEKWF